MKELAPCVLAGRYVGLEPLAWEHLDQVIQAGRGVDWTWMAAPITNRMEAENWFAASQRAWEKREEFVFVVKLRPGSPMAANGGAGSIVGSTRYMDIQASHKGVEIGGTWYSLGVQGTAVNPECKDPLLSHAFEDWGAVRVQIKTDNNNLRSQRAIVKLGAKFEGRLRNHRIRRDGTLRDTMMYSITKDEWPEVKANLAARVDGWRPGQPDLSAPPVF